MSYACFAILPGGIGYFFRALTKSTALGDQTESRITLQSPAINRTETNCQLDFYYYINPKTEGNSTALQVSTTSVEDDVTRVLAYIEGTEGNTGSWRAVSVRFDIWAVGEEFSIAIHAIFSKTATRSIIALDDISFRKCGAGMWRIFYKAASFNPHQQYYKFA